MDKITIERETLERAIRWHESRIWPGPDEVSVFDALRAALAAQPAEPAEQVAWLHICAKPGRREVYATVDPDDNKWWPADQWTSHTVHPLYAAPPAPAAVPPGMALVPIEPTPGIITTGTVALMKASDSDLDATREEIAATYRAMIAAAGDKP